MAIAKSLNINLAVFTGAATKQLNKAEGLVKGFAKGVSGIVAPFNNVTTAIAGLAGGAGLVALVKGSMDTIDANVKLATSLRATSEGLAGLQLAGNLAGVDANQLAKSMTKLTKSIGDARDGSSTAKAAFARLGLDANELATIPTDQAMIRIADAVKNAGASVNTTGALMDIFGSKVGANLINLLMAGGASLEEATKQAKEMGLAVSEVDAAKVEAANDAFTMVGESIKGAANRIAVELAPYLTLAATKITELIQTSKGTLAIGEAFKYVGTVVGWVADAFELLQMAFYTVRAGITKGIQLIVDGLGWIAKAIKNLTGVDLATDFLDAYSEDLARSAGEDWDKAKKMFAAPPSSDGVQDFFDNIQTNANAAANAIAEDRKKFNELGAEIEKQRLAEEQRRKEAEKVSKVFDDLKKKNESPFEKAKRELAELEANLAKAKALNIEVPTDIIEREKQRIVDELNETLDKEKGKNKEKSGKVEVAAVSRFSADIFAAVQKTKDPTTTEVKKSNVTLGQIKTGIDNLNNKSGSGLAVANL